jgi:hypothetical protein
VAKHFDLNIADTAFSFTRKTVEIAAEAAVDGVYVIPNFDSFTGEFARKARKTAGFVMAA